jgi:outer membrane protein, multidrug efflux system
VKKMVRLGIGVSLLVFSISSCTLYTKPKVESPEAPINFKNQIKAANKNTKLQSEWWKNFNDPELNKLVALALEKNLDYKVALKNIAIAKTYVDQNTSSFFPQINLNYSSTRESLSKNEFNRAQNVLSGQGGSSGSTFNVHQLNASVSYELDFWHQIGNSVNQAKADVKVSEANSNVVKLSLISDIVNTYLQIINLNENIKNLELQYNSAKEIAKETNNQYKSGLLNINPLADAKTQAEIIQTTISDLEKNKQILQNTLAYLCGEYPEKFNFPVAESQMKLHFPDLVPPELPSNMLLSRPDIQSSLFQVVSYGYLTKENLANFFPTFTLTGAYGFASNKLSNFLTNGSNVWNYGVNALTPVFDYKIRQSEYKRSKLQFEAANLTYRNTVINAFKEVDNALITYKDDYNSLKNIARQFNYSEEKYYTAKAQYKAGMISYADCLNYKIIYLQNKYNLNAQNLTVAGDVVQIYKTLGLGL